MKRYLFIFFTLISIWTLYSPAFILDGIIADLSILSQANAENRASLYQKVKTLWGGDQEQESQKYSIPKYLPQSFDELPGMPSDIKEIIELFKNSEQYALVGGKMPKGVLLYGPPGTGKTSAARVIALQAGAHFISRVGSEFVNIYVGVGPKKVRELFREARSYEKCVIFIDEFDSIASKRTDFSVGEYTNTLNELLSQMDGFKQNNNILVIAATNRLSLLDPAVLRPGRFDRIVELTLPNEETRLAIITCGCKKINGEISNELLTLIAHQTKGFSGADLKNLINEAALMAGKERALAVTDIHMKAALFKELERLKNITHSDY